MAKKVLLVDDEPHLVKAMEARLKAGGYEVTCAYDGQEGIDKARQDKPDCVILDHMMPKMDGLQVLRAIKEDEALRHIPLVMLTASGKADQIQAGMNQGFDAYITKPFKPEVLLGILKGLLGE